MILECTARKSSLMVKRSICREMIIKGVKKRFRKPAAGEKKMGFGALSGLSNTPPGVGGWVPEFVGLRLCTTKFDGLEPYGQAY